MRLTFTGHSAGLSPRKCSGVLDSVHIGVLAKVLAYTGIGKGHRRPEMGRRYSKLCAGGSLVEVIMSVAISAISVGGIMQGYIMSSQRVEWLTCSQAANSQAAQRIEQVRAAKWDSQAYPVVDEVVSTNFPTVVAPFDMPSTGNNQVYGTNVVTITTVSVSPPLKMVSVECTWRAFNRGVVTNTITVYRSPDQ